MSGLYNALFGTHDAAPFLLACLGIDQSKVPRYRSCYISGDRIVIHTRTGGGNRDYYESKARCEANYPEYFNGSQEAPDGPWNADLRALPGYDYDEDDDFDSTYADFYFRFPEQYKADLEALAKNDPSVTVTPSEQWQALFKAMEQATGRIKP